MLQDFVNLNNISPADGLTLFSNGLIWTCENYFNKQVFDTVVEGLKNGWIEEEE